MFGPWQTRNGRRLDPHGRAATSRPSPLGDGSRSRSRSSSQFTMPGTLRRATPTATVEVARPAPEVEFSRIGDAVRPALHGFVRGSSGPSSASLLSLRASQQGPPGFRAGSPALTPESQRASMDSMAGLDSAESDGSEGVEAGSAVVAAQAAQLGLPGSYDERHIPFRSNAVEIAAQDDRNECAFLPPLSDEEQRARSIMPLLTRWSRLAPPGNANSQCTLPGNREPGRPVAADSSGEQRDIAAFNEQARQRVEHVAAGAAMGQIPLQHLQAIVRQLLAEAGVEEDSGWDGVVCRLALAALQHVHPDVRHGGDKMDLRHYVRIKRIPGGEPADSQYVAGIVFTKNLAHRRMPRVLHLPRIMLLTMPLEPAPARYVAFDAALRSAQAFADKLVQRVSGAAPNLVLADRPVPRLILEGLMRSGIAVAYGVKRSVIRAVARCTGAEIVTSMEKFSDYPRLGTCRALTVQTFEHPSLPEFRKSFFFLDGCIARQGGTIVLRGADFGHLADIKQVMDLVICLSYSMVLETALLVDEYALAVPGEYGASGTLDPPESPDNDTPGAQVLRDYRLILSSSPAVRIPPPYVLVSMREHELAIRAITERFARMTAAAAAGSAASKDQPRSRQTYESEASSTGVSFLVSRHQSAAGSSRLRQQYESELALHESYLHEGRIFLHATHHPVSLWDCQSIAVTYMVTCRRHDYLLCAGPQCHVIPFYTGSDATLGEYLELCFVLTDICPSGNRRCEHPMYEHRHSYIHGHGRVDVTMDEYPCPIERLSETILMWAECTRCTARTPVVRMSDATWCYSFGKYLETTFYNATLRPRTGRCAHDLHHDYVRCFTLRNMVVRFSYSEFPIWAIATPTTPLFFDVEVSVRLKDEEAAELRKKLDDYYASLLSRLEAFPVELVYEDKVDDCRHVLHSLEARAATEHVYFKQSLEQTLRNTHSADTLVIVVVYEALQAKVVEWNLHFSELAQSFIQLDGSAKRKPAAPGPENSTSLSTLPSASGREIDSLEIIDELHSVADHYGPAADVSDRPGFEMPQLGASPYGSSTSLAEPLAPEERKVPRIHRRLSMEMMKQERERQERHHDKLRRTAAEQAAKVARAAQKSRRAHHMPQAPSDRPGGHDQRPGKHPKSALPGGYSTTRLIGNIATDSDDMARMPPGQTAFPELRNRKGKARAKFAGLINKGAQPLLDILHRTVPGSAEQHSGNAPPSRIPGIRTPQQATAQAAEKPSTKRPLSSFGKPPNARNSNIPRAPNIRRRAASPGSGDDDDDDHRNSPNVFLRLARRLNNTKGPPQSPAQQQQQQQPQQRRPRNAQQAMLGTVPRKMNLLLPAAAQYMSQHPRRPPMPQVQVFYTKPPADGSPSRRATPPILSGSRRHSYQVLPDTMPGGPMTSSGLSSRGSRTSRGNLPGAPTDMDSYRSARHRSATVSQVQHTQQQQHGEASHGRRSPAPGLPPDPPHMAGRSRPASALDGVDEESVKSAVEESKPSSSLRPSNFIPTITRRLGLGFGFGSSKSDASSTHATATDDENVESQGRSQPRSRVTSTGTTASLRDRGPVPPRLVIDHRTRPNTPLAVRRGNRTNSSVDSGDEAVEYAPISIDTSSSGSSSSSSSSLISLDDDLQLTQAPPHTPVRAIPRSYRNSSHFLDGHGSEPISADSSNAQMDLLMTSPLRTLHPSTRLSQHLVSSATDSDDASRNCLLDSVRRRNPRRDSSADDDLAAHEPDLHFGHSDAGSDAENIGADSKDASAAAAYLQSVIAENTQVSGARATDFSHDPSTASASATTVLGLPLTKENSVESGMDSGAIPTGNAESGTASAGAAGQVPQENITTLWKTISNLLLSPGTSQLFQIGLDLVYPLGPTEHVIMGSPIIVREAEPSSIIAFTLLDREFQRTLHTIFEEARTDAEAEDQQDTDGGSVHSSASSGPVPRPPLAPRNEFSKSPSPQPSLSPQSPSREEDRTIRNIMLHSLDHHMRFEFTAGQTKFLCMVYYAAQFEALRRCNGCEESYIESLSRCAPYLAKGGKSGSAFLRTRDERFIIKQVSMAEADAFLKFAPFYFEHMYWNWTFREDLPTVLAKIFGFCRISYHNRATGRKVKKMNVVIMENLFYGRQCSRVFDLKGSERNRMVDDTGLDAVLQDENMVHYIRENPICVRQQTKRHLHDAIWNDTLFLSKMNVMDYSLLVGFDEKNKELVVGMVDFIRTFTWDKQLESWVKEASILGGAGKRPTIVSPKQYKNRFREAMERYFLMVPDKYFVQQQNDDS